MPGIAAGIGTRLWTPLGAGVPLGFWWDFTDPGACIVAANALGTVRDKSGNNRDLTQGTAGNKPTYGTRLQNGLRVADFDGTDDYMSTSAMFTYGFGWTLFIVGKNDDGADSTAQFAVFGTDGSTAYGRFSKQTGNVYRLGCGSNLDRGTPDTNAHIHTVQFNNTTSYLRQDGAQVSTTGTTGTNSASVGVTVGSNSTPALFWDGWFGEIIGIPAILPVELIRQFEHYFAAKFAIGLAQGAAGSNPLVFA